MPKPGSRHARTYSNGGVLSTPTTAHSLAGELPDAATLREQINRCPPSVIRQMAYDLMQAAVTAHATGDLDALGQTVVDWASTVEVEQDAALRRRLARRRTFPAPSVAHD